MRFKFALFCALLFFCSGTITAIILSDCLTREVGMALLGASMLWFLFAAAVSKEPK